MPARDAPNKTNYVSEDGTLFLRLDSIQSARRNPDGGLLLGLTGNAIDLEPGPDADAISELLGLTVPAAPASAKRPRSR